MEVVKLQDAIKHQNSSECTVLEYAMQNNEINIGVAEITGRYPEEGFAVNLKCTEMGYIVKGHGKLVTETSSAELGEGDVVLIPAGEKYYWEGLMTVVMPVAPAWYPEQHLTNISAGALN
ncbi:MAG: DUF861 domain-containing protein [Verrucomicrobia bacterium]|nr:DUF861 domain-containing protein [Verrucomicrobiota bacterium]